jgi:hypothetical protein
MHAKNDDRIHEGKDSEGDELRRRKSTIQAIGIIEENESEIPGKISAGQNHPSFSIRELKFRNRMPMGGTMHVSPHLPPNPLLSAANLEPALAKGRGLQPQRTSENSAQDQADASAVAQANVKGLYARTLNRTGKISSATEDDTGPSKETSSSSESAAGEAASEDDSAASLPPETTTPAALTYTAKGVMSAVPATAGGVFSATV